MSRARPRFLRRASSVGVQCSPGRVGWYVYTKIQDQLAQTKPVAVPFVEGIKELKAVEKIRGAGLKPVVEFMTWNFANLALDQILNTASKMLAMSGGQVGCPIVFRGPGGSAGQLGAQHSTAYESMYANIPGLKVISVSNPYDGKGLLKSAIRDDDPVIFMECEVLYGEKPMFPGFPKRRSDNGDSSV